MKKKQRLQRSDQLWLIAVAVLVLLQFWWLPGDPGRPDDTYSNTIEGKRGFFETMKGLSDAGLMPSVRRESRVLVPNENCTLVILGPDLYPNEYEQRELADFVMRGGSLVFAPNWASPDCSIPRLSIRTTHGFAGEECLVTTSAAPSSPSAAKPPLTAESEAPSQSTGPTEATPSTNPASTTPATNRQPNESNGETINKVVRRANQISPGTSPAAPEDVDLEDVDSFDDVWDITTSSQLVEGSVKWRTRATLETSSTKPTVLVKSSLNRPQVASWNYGNGRVLLSASSDVFSNRAMLDESQAELAVRLVQFAHQNHEDDAPTTPIIISEFLNASDSYRGTNVLLGPSLRSGTLQLLTIALLAGWFGFHRFGPAKRDTSTQRRSLTESATAIGNLFFRTRSGSEAVRSYLEYFKSQLLRVFGNGIRIESTHAISLRTGFKEDEIKKRVNDAILLSSTGSTTASQAAAAIRDLSEILGKLSGATEANS